MPTPPIVIHNIPTANDPAGRFLTVPILPPPAAHIAAPSPAPSSPGSSYPHSPGSDYIPILHQPVPKLGKTPAKTPTLVIVPPPSPSPSDDDDGFTPVTPSPSPRSRGFRRIIRASQLPRDALGIATAGFARMKSQRAVGGYDDDHHHHHHHHDDDDREPLSPPYDAPAARAKTTTRKTLFGVLEGWWDLGLLERGKSLRRK